MTPDEIVEAANQQGCRSISYTYTEPTVFFEYAFDTAKLAASCWTFQCLCFQWLHDA